MAPAAFPAPLVGRQRPAQVTEQPAAYRYGYQVADGFPVPQQQVVLADDQSAPPVERNRLWLWLWDRFGLGLGGRLGRTSRISSSVSSLIGAMRPSAERPSRRLSMTQPLSCRVSPDLTGFRSPCWRIAAKSSQIGVGSASTGKSSPSTRRTARAVCSERVMAAPWPARTWLQSCAGSPSHATSGIVSNSQATTHSIGHCRPRAALCGGVKERNRQSSPCSCSCR